MQRSLIWKAFSTFWSLLWQKKHAIIWYLILKWEKANAAITYFLFFCCLCALPNASFRRNDIISRARQVVQVRYGNDSSEGAGCRNYLSHRADLSETKFNTLSSKWVDQLCFDKVFWDIPLFSSVVWCTKYWRAGKLKYLRKCIKFKIRRSILQQEQTLDSIEDDDGQPTLFISSLWYVSRESPLNLKACEFLIDFIWWIEIEILMCKFLYLGQISKFRQTLHFLVP